MDDLPSGQHEETGLICIKQAATLRGVTKKVTTSLPPEIRVNCRRIAAEAGVSRQAVSLALRNEAGVSAETRARILATAKKLGYTPQPAMSALMREMRLHPAKRQVLKMAFLNNWSEPFQESKAEPLRAFYTGALEKAKAMGYLVEVHEIFRLGKDLSKLNRLLRASGADGLLVFPSAAPAASLDIDWQHYSCVEIGQTLHSVPLPLITAHHFWNMGMICERLLAAGHQKIGFIHELHVHQRVEGEYLAAFLNAAWPLQQRHRFAEPAVVDSVTKELTLGYLAKHRCDALIVGPRFALEWLRGTYSVPRDLSVVSFSLYSADRRAKMAGVDELWEQVGGVAAEHLARLIQTHTRGLAAIREVVMVPGVWLRGRTFKPRQ
jgi:LacI family transcriptional regulator